MTTKPRFRMPSGRKLLVVLLFGMMVGGPCAAQSGAAGPSANNDATNDKGQRPSAAAGFQERNPRYGLRKGDSFDVDFAFSPEFNQTVVVQPDGYITLRGAGTMHVEGQTVPELTETIWKSHSEARKSCHRAEMRVLAHKKAYANILHNPVVTVAFDQLVRHMPKQHYLGVLGTIGEAAGHGHRLYQAEVAA